MQNIKIFGIKIDLTNSQEILNEIKYDAQSNQKCLIANVNINAMNIAYTNLKMKNFLNSAKINFVDGDGVNLGAKILNLPAGPKVTYDWWIWELAKFSEKNDLSWYILGAKHSSLQKAVNKLKNKFPNLIIAGYHDGYFNKNGKENETIINEINYCKPNILLMAMGMPMQEEWLYDNWNKININTALTGGAVVDYISGDFKSTPKIFRKLKLEWFFRFLQKPKYLFKRYFLGNPLFVFRVLLEKYQTIKSNRKPILVK